VAIADAPAEFRHISGGIGAVNDQEIISAGGGFGKRHHV
jgi:hypothetical protein